MMTAEFDSVAPDPGHEQLFVCCCLQKLRTNFWWQYPSNTDKSDRSGTLERHLSWSLYQYGQFEGIMPKTYISEAEKYVETRTPMELHVYRFITTHYAG